MGITVKRITIIMEVKNTNFRFRRGRIPISNGYMLLPKVNDADFDYTKGIGYVNKTHQNTQYKKTSWDTWVNTEDTTNDAGEVIPGEPGYHEDLKHHNTEFNVDEWGRYHIIDEGCCWTTMRQVENIERKPMSHDSEEFIDSASKENAVAFAACCVGDIGHEKYIVPFVKTWGYTNEWKDHLNEEGYEKEDLFRNKDEKYNTEPYVAGWRGNFNYHNIRDVGCCNVQVGEYDHKEGDNTMWGDLNEEGDYPGCSPKEVNTAIGIGVTVGLLFCGMFCYLYRCFNDDGVREPGFKDIWELNAKKNHKWNNDPY